MLFTILGIDVQSYGVSKAAAALVAAWLLGRAFERRGLKKDSAHALVLWATVWGFVGAKVYYLLEQYPAITMHDLGGMGFTWYGGLVGASLRPWSSSGATRRRSTSSLGQSPYP